MIVRELITRLGFTLDAKEADKYEARLKRLRSDAEKSSKKFAHDEAQRISRMARAETSVARLRGAQYRALQETERREHALEAQRQRSRERAEAHARRMERTSRNETRAQQRHEQQISATRQREADAQRRRNDALAAQQQKNQQRLSAAQAAASRAQIRDQSRINNIVDLGDQRRLRAAQVRQHASRRLQIQEEGAQRRAYVHAERLAAFQARQAHMRRAELLREQNLRLRGRQLAGDRQGGIGGLLAAGAAGAGGGVALSALMHRLDEMTSANVRLNSVFGTQDAESRNADIFGLANQAGVSFNTMAGVAYKTQRSAASLGIQGMTRERTMGIAEAIGLGTALSGSSAEASNAALIQLFQGLESNRLGGEELRSIMEQTPELARAIAKGMGFTREDGSADLGAFRQKAGEKGPGNGLTGKGVLEGLEKALPELRARAGEIPITFSRTFQQLSNRLNFFLLDVQKAANVTGKFNDVMISLADSVEKKIREIVANMGGWERATNALIAVIVGTAIPVIIRLAMAIGAWLGPLMLLAAPLALIFDSMLEFARKYPQQWAEATAKIKLALNNLVDSVLYALGMRLKPLSQNAKPAARVALEDRGNGVVAYKGKEYRSDDAALSQAILADHPQLAESFRKNGGRVRVNTGGTQASEIQTMPGGETRASSWPQVLEAVAKGIQAIADWAVEVKPYLQDTVKELRTIASILSQIYSKVTFGDSPNLRMIDNGVKDINNGNLGKGYEQVKQGMWNGIFDYFAGDHKLRYEAGLRESFEVKKNMAGVPITIGRVDVTMPVQTANSANEFIKGVEGVGKEAIRSAIRQGAAYNTAVEDTGRPTK